MNLYENMSDSEKAVIKHMRNDAHTPCVLCATESHMAGSFLIEQGLRMELQAKDDRIQSLATTLDHLVLS